MYTSLKTNKKNRDILYLIIFIILLLLICSSLSFYYTFKYIGKKNKKYRNDIILRSNQYYSKDKND